MKKTLFMAIMAGVALAGCVKNEEVVKSDGSPERITFDAPVVSVPTRATEIYGNYPKKKNFAVYALYHKGEYNANSFTATASSMYMTNETCTANKTGDNETPDYWAPATVYYWPKNGYLTFAAYAPAMEAVPAGDTGTAEGVKWGDTGFTFQNFTVNDTPGDQIDLLYSDRQYNKQSGSMVTNSPYDGITIPFKHALSSILFTVQTTETSESTTVTLTSIKVNNVVKKGTFAQNLTADNTKDGDAVPGWTLDASIADNVKDSYTVFPKTGTTGAMVITTEQAYVNGPVDGIDANSNGIIEENEKETYDTEKDKEYPDDNNNKNNGVRRSDLIVIPQSLKRGDGETDKVTVTIEYTIKTGDAAAVKDAHTFQLAVSDQDNDGNAEYVWEMGKRYTYHISIGMNRIYFNPQVSNWTDVGGTYIQ